MIPCNTTVTGIRELSAHSLWLYSVNLVSRRASPEPTHNVWLNHVRGQSILGFHAWCKPFSDAITRRQRIRNLSPFQPCGTCPGTP